MSDPNPTRFFDRILLLDPDPIRQKIGLVQIGSMVKIFDPTDYSGWIGSIYNLVSF